MNQPDATEQQELRETVLDRARLERIAKKETPECFTLKRDAAAILASEYLKISARETTNKVLAAMLEEMGQAEWGTDQHGAEMFVAFINKWHPMMRLALKDGSTPSETVPSVPATMLQEACCIALAISGHFCENPDEWLRGHEKRLRELEKIAKGVMPSARALSTPDAERYELLVNHWSSYYKGKPLWRFIEEDSLRVGGIVACLDEVLEARRNMVKVGTAFVTDTGFGGA